MEKDISKYLKKLMSHYSLTIDESKDLMETFLTSDFDPQIAASILSIITFKGESPEELTGFSKALTENMETIKLKDNPIDVIGITGSKNKTFNISTISSLILSCLGVKVAKLTKILNPDDFGSGDLLKALNINMSASLEQKEKIFNDENYFFINMAECYPLMKNIKKIENNLGFPTIASLITPICHPAAVSRMIIGTTDRIKASLISKTLKNLNVEKAYVIWNEEGFDEVVPIGNTKILIVSRDEDIHEISVTANNFNLAGNYKKNAKISVNSQEERMKIIDDIDSLKPGIALDTITMNVALGLRLYGKVNSLKEGTEFIKDNLKEGMLKEKISSIANISNS
jgi:anthranilate phosphoribosyltransferase